MKRILIMSVIVLLLANCKKSPNDTTTTSKALTFSPGHGVFIVNQGDYGHGNSSVSYLNLDSVVIHNNIFSSANGGVPIGDVAQSMTIDGSNGYVVINNSQRIEYVSNSTFKAVSSITGFTSPRYLLKVGASKAYVTDLFANKISVLNTQTNTISGSIAVNGWTEQMAQSGNQVFVTSPTGYSIYVINSQTDAFVDSITVGNAPTSICIDKNGMLWVYCVGDSYSPIVNPSLYEINPQNQSIVKSFNFSSVNASEGSLCMNSTADSLFFIHGDVYRMSINDAQLPPSSFISSSGGTKDFYGLLKTPDGRVLVCDAQNFTQTGLVYVYTAGGSLIKSLSVAADGPSDMVYY